MAIAYEVDRPARAEFLPYVAPAIGDEEVAAVEGVLRSRWIGQGPLCQRFEREIADYVGAADGVFVSSCTAAMHLSLIALGVGPGDEVVTTPFTFIATANVIELCGARPVLVDIDPATLNLTPEGVRRALTPRTKAVLGVHFAGRPLELDELRAAVGRDVAIVEDAAHALGGRDATGRPIGRSGNLVCFSFDPNKNITCCEGGMIVTGDLEAAARLRTLRLHGLPVDAWKRYRTQSPVAPLAVEPGFKYNGTDLNAAIGLEQLKKIEVFLARREAIAAYYDDALASFDELEIIDRSVAPPARHAQHLYIVAVRLERLRATRDEVVAALRRENIGASVHYHAVHLHPYYSRTYGWRPEDFPCANARSSSVMSIPYSPLMSDDDAACVVTALRRVIAFYRR